MRPHATTSQPTPPTVVDALLERDQRSGWSVALRYKRYGLWHQVTWSQLSGLVSATAAGLHSVGVVESSKVITQLAPGLDAVVMDLAVQALGASSWMTHRAGRLPELGGDRVMVLVTDRLTDTGDQMSLGPVRVILPNEESSTWTLEEVQSAGKSVLADSPTWLTDRARVSEGSIGFVTGSGRLLEALPARTIVTRVRSWLDNAFVGRGVALPNIDDSLVVDADLAHPLGRLAGVIVPILTGAIPHFPERAELVAEARREVRPTLAMGPSTPYVQAWAELEHQIVLATPVRRLLLRTALRMLRHRVMDRSDHQSRPNLVTACAHVIADALITGPLRKSLALDRVRLAVCGWAPLPQRTYRGWHQLGLPLVDVYGLTEVGVPVAERSVSAGGFRPYPGVALTNGSDSGLTVVWESDGETPQAIGTGDVGIEEAEGTWVTLLGRAAELTVTDAEAACLALFVERLSDEPLVSRCFLGRVESRTTVLVEPNFLMLATWARDHGVTSTSAADLVVSPKVQERYVHAVLLAGRSSGATIDAVALATELLRPPHVSAHRNGRVDLGSALEVFNPISVAAESADEASGSSLLQRHLEAGV